MPETDTQGSFMIPSGVLAVCCFLPQRILPLDKSHFISVTLPETVQTIEDHAFSDCISLEKINTPRLVKKIYSTAFLNCNALKRIAIPADAEVELGAFEGCNNLVEVDYDRDVPWDTFKGTPYGRILHEREKKGS